MLEFLEVYRSVFKAYEKNSSRFEDVYKDLHQHPELSLQEQRTAEIAAKHLDSLGFEVHRGVGGHGVAGVLRNGGSKTVLLRADMDALPIFEETNLPYASQVQQVDEDGVTKPVMHACGHDMHTTCLMGAAEALATGRRHWSGTLVCVFQPNEERSEGALAMLRNGLYQKVPIPDVCFGQHVMPNISAGAVATRPGSVMAGAKSFEISIFGLGGHASTPNVCVNPIVIASSIVMRMQETFGNTGSEEHAIVTCGSLQAGDAYNIIPSVATLKVEVRAYDNNLLLEAEQEMLRIVREQCVTHASPKAPVFTLKRSCPPTVNDPEATAHLNRALTVVFGPNQPKRVQIMPKDPGCEDFPHFAAAAEAIGVPARQVFWNIGTEDSQTLHGPQMLHSSTLAPSIQPTVDTGVTALIVGALDVWSRSCAENCVVDD